MGGYNTVTVLEDRAPLGSDSSAKTVLRGMGAASFQGPPLAIMLLAAWKTEDRAVKIYALNSQEFLKKASKPVGLS